MCPLLLALLVAVATGCSGADPRLAANSDYARDERMFASGYADIDRIYIEKPDMGYLTMGGTFRPRRPGPEAFGRARKG